MKKIYKYPLEMTNDIETIQLPFDASTGDLPHILPKIIMQNHRPHLYAAVNTNATDTVDVEVLLIGTGHGLPGNIDTFTHLDTVSDGPFVWHVFAKINKP